MKRECFVVWEGFTASEKRKAEKLWSTFKFESDFCDRHQISVARGTPGSDGIIAVQARNIKDTRQHLTVSFSATAAIEEIVDKLNLIVSQEASRYMERS